MSSNESKPNFLGQKINPKNDISLTLKNIEQVGERKEKCHYCNRDGQLSQTCITCSKSFCINCINVINENKDSSKTNHSKKDDMIHWICFICLKECPCKSCGFEIKEKEFSNSMAESKCLICKSNLFLIKIDDKLAKIKLSEEKKKELIEKNNEVSLILQANQKDERLICHNCLTSNSLVNDFLRRDNNNNIDRDHNKGNDHDSEISNKNIANENRENKNDSITKQLIIDLQSQYSQQQQHKDTNSLNENQQSQANNQSFHPTNMMNSSIQNNTNTNANTSTNNNINNPYLEMMQQIPQSLLQQPMSLSLNMFLPQQNLPNLRISPLSMMQNNYNQQQQKQNTANSLKNSFAHITQLMQKYNNQSIQNNLNVLSNINQLSAILSMISDKKLQLNQNDPNEIEKENSTIKSIWAIIQNIKTQISITNDFTQIQKGLIVQVMKTLEQSMQQEVNQNLMNDPSQSQCQMNNPLMTQPQMGNSDSVLSGLLANPLNQGIPLSHNQSHGQNQNQNVSNLNDKSSHKAGQSPSSHITGSQVKEENKNNLISNQDNNKGMQGQSFGQVGLSGANNHFNPNAIPNSQLPNYLMASNILNHPQYINPLQGSSNINMMNNCIPLNPFLQSGIPSFMYGNPSTMPYLDQIQQRNASLQQGMSLPSLQIPQESIQMNQEINPQYLFDPNLFQGMNQGVGQNQSFQPSISYGLPQMPPEINQGLPPTLDLGLQQRLASIRGMPQGLPPHMMMYYLNQSMMGDQLQGLRQNQSGANEQLMNNSVSHPKEDSSHKKKV